MTNTTALRVESQNSVWFFRDGDAGREYLRMPKSEAPRDVEHMRLMDGVWQDFVYVERRPAVIHGEECVRMTIRLPEGEGWIDFTVFGGDADFVATVYGEAV